MIEILQQFAEPWAIRALIASALVGITCGILGCFIVLRNMALIGDALSHAILPGVVVAFMIGLGGNTIGRFAGAVIAGLLTAIIITWIQRNVKTKNDAAIGIVFTAMFSLGVIGISYISRQPGVHLDLKDFLFGQVLGVTNEDLWLTFGVTGYVLVSVVVFYRYLFITTFQPVIAQTMGISVSTMHYFLMLLLSFAVVAALSTVGVILVVAMLVTPASTALLLTNRLHYALVIAAFFGFLSAAAGLFFAILFETTPGPAMAVTATVFYLVAAFFSPKKGLVFRFFQKRRLQSRIRLEDVLKLAYRQQQQGQLTLDGLLQGLGFSKTALQTQLQILRSKNLLEKNSLALTEEGREEGRRLVRAHRLWETYLASEMGLSAEQIHEDADKYEHLLTDEILDEVDKTLGYPTTDPHGSPIPARRGLPEFSLLQLLPNQQATIAAKQSGEHVSSRLWQLGLLPETVFSILNKATEFIEVEQAGKHIQVPVDLARRVKVLK
ncbi:MAG: metal ABC transporter permease [Saprospiraceae bacterium]|nr:metal ABC transporter permease [Saprospiraceae bacterium]MCF8252779.1 metal ABC transporter permease [Saprospiraceae bacterium]MCF8283170.1 metal ABC transporter permease [Bacteroidales bacterium]MCF8314334.1 metal ABC transporter permease [Saprospiraceae bacterium]MCF8443206.1 metal ABC transporter permease [Saprospiraceae bacterium]